MKVLSFGQKQILKLREKAALFRGKLRSFMLRLAKELLVILPILFLIILFANIFSPKSDFQNIKENILLNKNSVENHNKLGQLFFAANDFSLARLEFSTESATLAGLLNEPSQIKNQIIYWQKLVDQVPTYRDGYIKLFVLNSKLYRDFDAKKFLEKVLSLDPNLSLP